MLLMFMEPDRSSSNKSKILLMPFYINLLFTLDSLSPNLAVIPSKNSSKSISRPSAYKSAIILNMVGFLDSKPRLCIADFNSLNSRFFLLGIYFASCLGVKKIKCFFKFFNLISCKSRSLHIFLSRASLISPLHQIMFKELKNTIQFENSNKFNIFIYLLILCAPEKST